MYEQKLRNLSSSRKTCCETYGNCFDRLQRDTWISSWQCSFHMEFLRTPKIMNYYHVINHHRKYNHISHFDEAFLDRFFHAFSQVKRKWMGENLYLMMNCDWYEDEKEIDVVFMMSRGMEILQRLIAIWWKFVIWIRFYIDSKKADARQRKKLVN